MSSALRCSAYRRRFQVEPRLARAVARQFHAQQSRPDDPVVAAAYRQLAEQAHRWFERITSVEGGVRVAFSALADPYRDAAELRDAVRSTGTLELHSVAYDRDRRHPLLGCRVGGSLDRFRAVHDVVSHAWGDHDFDRDGEYSSWRAEHLMYRGLARDALATELHAHHSVRWTTGEVAPYRAVLLDRRLLDASMRAGRSVPV